MNKDSILYGVVGLLAGVVIAGFTAGQAVNSNNTGMMNMMGIRSSQGMMDNGDMSMSGMLGELQNKTGDDFDAAFLQQMIIHHQGAIDMAKLIPQNAKHDELKKLGEAIISAQTKEIQDMKQWQADWNFDTSSNNDNQEMMH